MNVQFVIDSIDVRDMHLTTSEREPWLWVCFPSNICPKYYKYILTIPLRTADTVAPYRLSAKRLCGHSLKHSEWVESVNLIFLLTCELVSSTRVVCREFIGWRFIPLAVFAKVGSLRFHIYDPATNNKRIKIGLSQLGVSVITPNESLNTYFGYYRKMKVADLLRNPFGNNDTSLLDITNINKSVIHAFIEKLKPTITMIRKVHVLEWQWPNEKIPAFVFLLGRLPPITTKATQSLLYYCMLYSLDYFHWEQKFFTSVVQKFVNIKDNGVIVLKKEPDLFFYKCLFIVVHGMLLIARTIPYMDDTYEGKTVERFQYALFTDGEDCEGLNQLAISMVYELRKYIWNTSMENELLTYASMLMQFFIPCLAIGNFLTRSSKSITHTFGVLVSIPKFLHMLHPIRMQKEVLRGITNVNVSNQEFEDFKAYWNANYISMNNHDISNLLVDATNWIYPITSKSFIQNDSTRDQIDKIHAQHKAWKDTFRPLLGRKYMETLTMFHFFSGDKNIFNRTFYHYINNIWTYPYHDFVVYNKKQNTYGVKFMDFFGKDVVDHVHLFSLYHLSSSIKQEIKLRVDHLVTVNDAFVYFKDNIALSNDTNTFEAIGKYTTRYTEVLLQKYKDNALYVKDLKWLGKRNKKYQQFVDPFMNKLYISNVATFYLNHISLVNKLNIRTLYRDFARKHGENHCFLIYNLMLLDFKNFNNYSIILKFIKI